MLSSKSSSLIPEPLSETKICASPADSVWMSICVELASMEFSNNSLMTECADSMT